MNRLKIKYTSAKDNICSNLEIYNDIKGVSYEKVGYTFYGKDADLMFEYFKNVILKENNNVMNYGLYVNNEEININKEKR